MSNFDKLGNVANGYGGSGFPEYLQGNINDDIPFIKVSDFNLTENVKYIVKANNYVSKELAENNKFRIFPKNTIVIAKVGAAVYLNRKRILKQDTIIDNNLMGIIPKIDVEFLYQSLLHIDLTEKVQQGALPSLTFNLLSDINLFVPDLPTQKRIAKILSTVDGQIEKTEAIIAKYQAIKQGMLHDLFTRGIDLVTGKLRPIPEQSPELYKPSPLGLIPKDWNYKTLKDITLVNQGLQIPISSRYKDYKENRHLYITIQLLNNPMDESYTYYIENPPMSVVCKTQDILMVRTGNTGAVITNIAGCFHNNFFKISYNSEHTDRDYLVQHLNLQHIQEKIMNYAGTTTIPDLKHGDFYKLPYLEPEPEEQKYISAKINKIAMLIVSENKVLEKLQKLKQGLVSKLLNGTV